MSAMPQSTITRSTPLAGLRAGRDLLATGAFWAALAGVAGLLLLDLGRGLGMQDVADWDEGRHAVNAYEMLQRGDWLVQTWRGHVDYWNLKPPLSMWAEMLSFQAFGFTPFALRLPAAVATVLTVAVVAVFAHRLAGRTAAVTAALALTTCQPFITVHAARTGDPDALFLLGLTVALVGVLEAPRRPRLLLLVTAGFSFAFLAKSFHAALLIPFAIAYLLWTRRSGAVRARHLALALLGLLPLAAWALARSAVDGTRFLSAMFLVDVLHRTERPAEGNGGGPTYYGTLLLHFFGPWLLVLAVAVAVWLVLRRRGVGLPPGTARILVALAAWSAGTVLVFSLMATKLPWYTLPAYPPLAVLVGVMVATAARGAGAPRLVLLIAAVVIAAEVGQSLVATRVLAARADPVQSVLQSLHRDPAFIGRTVRLDPAAGTWRQGRVASAELNGGLVPKAGGARAALRDARSLVVVRRGSALDRAYPGAVAGAVASTGRYVVVPAAALISARDRQHTEASPHA